VKKNDISSIEVPSFIEMLQYQELLTMWKPLLDAKKYFLGEDDRIYTAGQFTGVTGVNIDSPWIYTNNNPRMYCDWWQDVAEIFKFVPTYCLDCWKVCAKPKSVAQLMLVYKEQIKMVEEFGKDKFYCKCGIERRPHVFGNYGAYFYNRSKEEGLDKLDLVRERLHKIDSTMDIHLKRGCTEFERNLGPTDTYKQPPEASVWEPLFKKKFAMIPWEYQQSESVIQRVMREWIKFAWDRGDFSVYQFTNNKPLGRPCVIYERENKEGK
jgi:hypothetical protein